MIGLRSITAATAVERYLRSKGVDVLSTDRNAATITARGSIRALDSAFGVRIYRWLDRSTGQYYSANDTQVILPAPLNADVLEVVGLDGSVHAKPFANTYDETNHYTASQLRTAYNAAIPGVDGSGQTVAIYAQGGFSSQNVEHYAADNNLPAPHISISVPDGNMTFAPSVGKSPTHDLSEDETEEDIEVVNGMAPGAAIHVYQAPASDSGLESADVWSFTVGFVEFIQGVMAAGEHVASISYGWCESAMNRSDLNFLSGLFRQAAEGHQVSIFAGSGDSGPFCFDEVDRQGVNYPASDPSITAVGGTYLNLNTDSTINFETAWDNQTEKKEGGGVYASGGGASQFFCRPTYQNAIQDLYPLAGCSKAGGVARLVPDVAADADPHSSLNLYEYLLIGINGNHAGGGTSQSAPLWAGIGALYNQYAESHKAALLGNANPLLYRIAGLPSRPLFDVTTAQEDKHDDLAGPPWPGPGWDMATGLGTPNVAAILNAGVPGSVPSPAPTVTPPAPTPTPPSPSPIGLTAQEAADQLVTKSGAACLSLGSHLLVMGSGAAAFTYGGGECGPGAHFGLTAYVYQDGSGWHGHNWGGTQNFPLPGFPDQGPQAQPNGGPLSLSAGCLRVRQDHSLSAKVVTCMPSGTILHTTGLPVYQDGHIWWLVETGFSPDFSPLPNLQTIGWADHDLLLCGHYPNPQPTFC